MAVRLFRLKSSYYLAILLLIMHSGAIVCIWALAWFWWVKLLLVFATLVSFVTLFRQHVLLNTPHAVIEFCQLKGGSWQLRDNLADVKTVMLADNSICTRYFVLLNFNPIKQLQHRSPISVLVLSDSLNEHDFRHLRRQLRSIY